MIEIFWIAGLSLLLLGMAPLFGAIRLRAYVRKERDARRARFAPPLSVILPCKGIDPNFLKNINALLHQDYPDYELLIVTATEDDPARKTLLERYPSGMPRHARLLVAGIQPGRSQKLNNQLYAVAHARPESDVFVFVDSDAQPGPGFLSKLVEPLSDDGVGATTGYRWYIPVKGGLGSYLRATWNGGGLSIMADPKLAYAWGGAMAIYRDVYERGGVEARWSSALTDDFPLTDAVHEQGLRVHFVPDCLVASYEDTPLADTVEWTNRQTVICRVYNSRLWTVIFWIHAVHAAGLMFGIICASLALAAPSVWNIVAPGILALAALPLEVMAGLLLWRTAMGLLPAIGGWRRAAKHICLVPVAMTLIFWNSMHSLLTRDIRWRGVRYRLHSAQKTEVLSEVAEARA